jgi:hypothetical protein
MPILAVARGEEVRVIELLSSKIARADSSRACYEDEVLSTRLNYARLK